MNDLAIIIPAYKRAFLGQALESFAIQTDKRFTIYIGDDNSPEDIASIVDTFQGRLDIRYTRFGENMGSVSLVKHWERCIELSKETWIWLFSDDDFVAPDCVEVFYREKEKSSSRLFRFNVAIVDAANNILRESIHSMPSMTAAEFIKGRLEGRLICYAVEFIFNRSLFEKKRFVEFPLAWCSDDATWTTFMVANDGIVTHLPQAKVYWRLSNSNISGRLKDKSLLEKRERAVAEFIVWLKRAEPALGVAIPERVLATWLAGQLSGSGQIYTEKSLRHLLEPRGIILSKEQLAYVRRCTMISNLKQRIKWLLGRA